MLDGVGCEDLNEGELGNRWFVGACSSLANNKALYNKVRGASYHISQHILSGFDNAVGVVLPLHNYFVVIWA